MTHGFDHRHLTQISNALIFAMRAHAGTERRPGEPYVAHPFRVAIRALLHGMDPDSVVAALLHDVVEDADVPIQELTSLFGERAAGIVSALTKSPDGTPNRDELYREQLLSGPREAKQIKLFDIEDNLADIDSFKPPEGAAEYRRKRGQLALALRDSLQKPPRK